MSKEIVFRPIGWIQSPFEHHAPPDEIRAVNSEIHLDPSMVEGLQGLEPGQEILVVFYFHKSQGYELIQHKRGDPQEPARGVFALRSPNRPNPIGVTRVKLLEIDGAYLVVEGLDAINGTPLLDIKPA